MLVYQLNVELKFLLKIYILATNLKKYLVSWSSLVLQVQFGRLFTMVVTKTN